jgi:trehalose synthase
MGAAARSERHERLGLRKVEISEEVGLEDYAGQAYLAAAVGELQAEAAAAAPALAGRRLWMLNSTASGGGVAEMLPKLVRLLRDLGLPTEWLVLETERPGSFELLTKRIHNLLHGAGDPRLEPAERELYEAVSQEAAAELRRLVAPGDILVVHDPQPLGAGALLRRETPTLCVWRCHIGLDERPPAVRAAWEFLKPYATEYDHAVFTASEYIPDYLAGRASTICPGIDPASFKNRELNVNKLFGILCNSGLARAVQPVLRPAWAEPARRLRPDGSFVPAAQEEVGLGYRPVLLQVSRWDRLKGWRPLLHAFARLKSSSTALASEDARHRRRRDLVRLVLAGPDPGSIQDDPEAREVLAELTPDYRALPPALQSEVALLTLPMGSAKRNALMVNVLQRCAVVVVQNSLREGFGLTVTEAGRASRRGARRRREPRALGKPPPAARLPGVPGLQPAAALAGAPGDARGAQSPRPAAQGRATRAAEGRSLEAALVRGRPVDRRHRRSVQPEVDGELAAVVRQVGEDVLDHHVARALHHRPHAARLPYVSRLADRERAAAGAARRAPRRLRPGRLLARVDRGAAPGLGAVRGHAADGGARGRGARALAGGGAGRRRRHGAGLGHAALPVRRRGAGALRGARPRPARRGGRAGQPERARGRRPGRGGRAGGALTAPARVLGAGGAEPVPEGGPAQPFS